MTEDILIYFNFLNLTIFFMTKINQSRLSKACLSALTTVTVMCLDLMRRVYDKSTHVISGICVETEQ